MPAERWLPVVDYEGLYEVSDLGRVRSVDRVVDTKTGPRRYRGRVLALLVVGDGDNDYLGVTLCHGDDQRRALVAHLVLEAFVGPRPDGLVARHGNDNGRDDRLANLQWAPHRRARTWTQGVGGAIGK